MEGASVVATEAGAQSFRANASWGTHVGATLKLGLPLVGAQLAQMAIHVTDTAIVARLGASELAAAVLATQGFFLVWIFGAGFAQGFMPIAAAAEGRGDPAAVRRSVRMGFWALAFYGVLVMPALWHFEAILLVLGQEPETAKLSGGFMHILQWAMIPALFVAGARCALSVLSRAGVVLFVTFGGAVLNGVLVWLLVFGHLGLPRLGLNGAAVASLLVNVAMAIGMLAYAATSPALARYGFFRRIWRPDWPAFGEILRLGWPISTTIIAEVGLFAASSVMMGWLGTVALAAHGIALQLASIAFMIPLGLAQAATVRVGVAFGREEKDGIAKAGWTALALAVGAGLAGALLFWTIPERLVGLYLDPTVASSAAVMTMGVQLLVVAAAFQMVDCVQVVSSGLLRGLADTRVPMILAVVSYWLIGMPVAWVLAFPLGHGGVGIWIGLALGLLTAALLMTARFARRERLGLVQPPSTGE